MKVDLGHWGEDEGCWPLLAAWLEERGYEANRWQGWLIGYTKDRSPDLSIKVIFFEDEVVIYNERPQLASETYVDENDAIGYLRTIDQVA